MNRREALAAASVLFGGAIVGSQSFLAGCVTPTPASAEIPFLGLLSAEDMALLDEVGETILPTTTDSPGAKAAKVGEFMNVIVTDCYSPRDQELFQAGLHRLNATTLEEHEQYYVDLTAEEKHAFLLTLEDEARAFRKAQPPRDPAADEDPEVHYYSMIKQLTVWGYFSSEIGATQALRYVAVPGRWDPCIPYAEGEKAWA